eukprot:2749575-Lingulodinium_polyedra.AAC.1
MLERAFVGIGQTKVVEDGVKVLREAEEGSKSKKLGPRAKWCALYNSAVLAGLHRLPAVDAAKAPLPKEAEPRR